MIDSAVFSRALPLVRAGVAALSSAVLLACVGAPKATGAVPSVAPTLVGVAADDITPPFPAWQMGTERRVTDHYRRMEVQAMAIGDRASPVVIVTADICMFCTEVSEQVYARVKRLGFEPHEVVLNASHNHSAPAVCPADVLDVVKSPIAEYQEFLIRKIVSVIERAREDMKPAVLATSEADSDLCVNRDGPPHTPGGIIPNPGGSIDRRVRVLRVSDPENGTLRAVLALFACHPSDVHVVKDGPASYGADFFGFGRDEVARRYPEATVMTAQGAGGDVRMAHFVNGDPSQGFDGSALPNLAPNREFGRRFGTTILQALDKPATPVQGPVRAAMGTVNLPLEEPYSREFVARVAKGEAAPADNPDNQKDPWYWRWGQWMLDKYERGETIPRTTGAFDIRMIQFGDDFRLAALDGEVFTCVARQIEQRLSPQRTFVLAYNNNVKAYVPCAENFAPPQNGGNYEIQVFYWWLWQTARFTPEVDRVIVDEAVAVANRLDAAHFEQLSGRAQ